MTILITDGILNPSIGEKYRTEILAPGASKSANELLINFLSREPNQIAFLKAYGLE